MTYSPTICAENVVPGLVIEFDGVDITVDGDDFVIFEAEVASVELPSAESPDMFLWVTPEDWTMEVRIPAYNGQILRIGG